MQVIESPYTKGKLSIRNIFSEVTSEINISHTGPTKPPSAAAAQVHHPEVHVTRLPSILVCLAVSLLPRSLLSNHES